MTDQTSETPKLTEAEIEAAMKQHAEKPFTDADVFGLLDCYSVAFIKARVELSSATAQVERLTKELAMANDAAAKGDLARANAGGMEMQINDLTAQLAERDATIKGLKADAERWRWVMSMGSVRVVKYDNFNNEKYLCQSDIDEAIALSAPSDWQKGEKPSNPLLNCGDCGLEQGWAESKCPRCGRSP